MRRSQYGQALTMRPWAEKGIPELDLGSRILVSSDIFCALPENLLYREGITYSQRVCILNEMVQAYKPDAKIMSIMISNIDPDCALIRTNIYR